MIYPLYTAEEWSRLYDLPIQDFACIKWGKIFTVNIPIATKLLRGFKAVPHDCGEEYTPTVVIPIDGNTRKSLIRFRNQAINFLT
jgi:hypothetical protein